MKRYRKVMGLAIVLVALAVAINALAFKTAQVTNSASFTISASNTAALGIDVSDSPGTGFSFSGTGTGSGTLTISDQMQPNSIYVFSNVFRIVNHATSGTDVVLTAPSFTLSPADATLTVTLYQSGATLTNGVVTGTPLTGISLDQDTDNTAAEVSGSYVDVDVVVTVGATATGAKSGSIVVSGTNP